MQKAYKFSLRPTKKQAKILQQYLDECRWLYNLLLEQRKLAYEELGSPLTWTQQKAFLPLLKEERSSLILVYSQVLQDVTVRLDRAFQAFFRRCKAGENPGFPRFRNFHRYDSFCYPQSGFCLERKFLQLSKIGRIRIKQHRPIVGIIKTCTIRKDASGHWHVSFSCIVETNPLPRNDKAVGIDLGLEHFAALKSWNASTWEEKQEPSIENPRFFRKEEKELAKAQRKLSSAEKGTSERKKCRKLVAKIHERIRNKRADFCHKQSRNLIDKYQYICLEDLNTQKMLKEAPRPLAKSIADASWNQFCQYLSYKAEEAGRKLGWVDPRGTSQICSRCQVLVPKELSQRRHDCPHCGYSTHRDFNSSEVILARGLAGLGLLPLEAHPL